MYEKVKMFKYTMVDQYIVKILLKLKTTFQFIELRTLTG